MRIYAIFGDVHANIEALDVVLEDFEGFVNKTRNETLEEINSGIVNLGDLIGYGADPVACLEHSEDWDYNIQGNHCCSYG